MITVQIIKFSTAVAIVQPLNKLQDVGRTAGAAEEEVQSLLWAGFSSSAVLPAAMSLFWFPCRGSVVYGSLLGLCLLAMHVFSQADRCPAVCSFPSGAVLSGGPCIVNSITNGQILFEILVEAGRMPSRPSTVSGSSAVSPGAEHCGVLGRDTMQQLCQRPGVLCKLFWCHEPVRLPLFLVSCRLVSQHRTQPFLLSDLNVVHIRCATCMAWQVCVLPRPLV